MYSQAESNCVTFAAEIRNFSDPAKKAKRARIGKIPNSGALKVRGSMGHQFLHPLGKELLKPVAQVFRSENSYILRDSKIVFVCGGSVDGPSMRSRFLKYATAELTHLRMFLAEAAEKDYVSNEEATVHNVGEFEDLIGEVSDCLIIFPESPGSFAELGYFSKNQELSKKILIVNDANLQGIDSFILRGPIHLIDSTSIFSPTIQMEYGDGAKFEPVRLRLENRITGKKRKKFEFTKYADLTFRKKFFAIFEIVRLFEVLTLEAVEYAFRSIFKNVNPSELKQSLSILVAADLIHRSGYDNEYFCIDRKSKPFMEFDNFDEVPFRLALNELYTTEFPDIASVVKGLSDDH